MKKTLLFATICVALFGCQSGNNEPTPVQEEDKQLVQSVTTVSIILNRTIRSVSTYDYNSSNQLTAMHERYDDHAGPNSDHVYTYDSQGEITKSTITRDGIVSVFDYTYKDGAPVSVAYTMPANTSDFHNIAITASNDLVTKQVTTTTPGSGNSTTEFAYTNGNNTSENIGHFTSDGVNDISFTYTREYGTKKSPYLYSGHKWMLPDMQFANKNELIKISGTSTGSLPFTITYTYTYDANGYPVTAQTVTAGAGLITTTSTITYTYVKAK